MNNSPEIIQFDENFALTCLIDPSINSDRLPFKVHTGNESTYQGPPLDLDNLLRNKLNLFLHIFKEYTIHLEVPSILTAKHVEYIIDSFEKYLPLDVSSNRSEIHIEDIINGLTDFYKDTGILLLRYLKVPTKITTELDSGLHPFTIQHNRSILDLSTTRSIAVTQTTETNSLIYFENIFNKFPLKFVVTTRNEKLLPFLKESDLWYMLQENSFECKLLKYLSEYFPEEIRFYKKESVVFQNSLNEFLNGNTTSGASEPRVVADLNGIRLLNGYNRRLSYNSLYKTGQKFKAQLLPNGKIRQFDSSYIPGTDSGVVTIFVNRGKMGYTPTSDLRRLFNVTHFYSASEKYYDQIIQNLKSDDKLVVITSERFETFEEIPFISEHHKKVIAVAIVQSVGTALLSTSSRNNPTTEAVLNYANAVLELPVIQEDLLTKQALQYLISIVDPAVNFEYVNNYSCMLTHPSWRNNLIEDGYNIYSLIGNDSLFTKYNHNRPDYDFYRQINNAILPLRNNLI